MSKFAYYFYHLVSLRKNAYGVMGEIALDAEGDGLYTGKEGIVPMSEMKLLARLPLDCEEALRYISRQLAHDGLTSVPSLDIPSCCAPETSSICPHSGESPCSCQLVTLAVTDDSHTSICLVVHSHGRQSEVYLGSSSAYPSRIDLPLHVELLLAA